MKTFIPILFAISCATPLFSAEPARSQVSISVRKQVVESNHNMIGLDRRSSEKTLTLRVVLRNTTGTVLTGATISGDALILREAASTDILRGQSISTIELPSLLPNESFTYDLGSITLQSFESSRREVREKLEAWKITCCLDGQSLGESITGEFDALEEQLRNQRPVKAANPRRFLKAESMEG